MKVLYGPGMMVYNVHGLMHLADDVRVFGALDNFSVFPFENKLKSQKILFANHLSYYSKFHGDYMNSEVFRA